MFRRSPKEGEHKGVVPIGDLLSRYRVRLRPPQGVVIEAFRAIVSSELGINLSLSSVRYSVFSRTLSVNTSGPEKSEILFNKRRILALCVDVLGKTNAPEQIL